MYVKKCIGRDLLEKPGNAACLSVYSGLGGPTWLSRSKAAVMSSDSFGIYRDHNVPDPVFLYSGSIFSNKASNLF